MPPKIKSLVPSQTNPKAAQPGGMSPCTAGTNHWFVAIEKLVQKNLGHSIYKY